MATPSECNQQEIVEQIAEQRDCPNENSVLIADANEAFAAGASDRQQPAKVESLIKTQVSAGIAGTRPANPSQLNKAEPSSASGKLIATDSCLNGLTNLNGTKITGKLVAVRKDGNSYTFTTSASAVSGGSNAKTFTLATPTSKGGNTALITVAKPQHLTLSSGCAAGTPPATQRLYYNKTTNTIEHSIAPPTAGRTTQDDLQTDKINMAKPIILQMKRKIQVLNDENRKTARIFTIPSGAGLINSQSNQFILMNRGSPKPASSLLASSSSSSAGSGSIKARMASLAKPITANLSVLERRASLSISNSISSASRSSPPVVASLSSSPVATATAAAAAAKLKAASLVPVAGEPAASITIVSKQKSNSTALLNKLTTVSTAEHLVDNKIKPKLDAKMLSIEGEPMQAATESFTRPAGYLSTIEQSACLPNLAANNSASNLLDTSDGDNKIVKVDAENLLGEKQQGGELKVELEEETTVELAEETVVQETEMEEMVEHYDCQPAIAANVSTGPLEHSFSLDSTVKPGRRTTMESLIESTIESSFECSSTGRKASAEKDTCVDACVQAKSVSGNNAANCIKIAQDIEFSPNSVGRSNALARERSVSLDSLRNGPPAQQFNMPT